MLIVVTDFAGYEMKSIAIIYNRFYLFRAKKAARCIHIGMYVHPPVDHVDAVSKVLDVLGDNLCQPGVVGAQEVVDVQRILRDRVYARG